MITDTFLNSCFSILLSKKSRVRKTQALYRDILNILQFYEETTTLDIPLVVKNKVDCLKKVTEMLLEDKNIHNILDSISLSEKYKDYIDFLNLKVESELKEPDLTEIIQQVRLRKEISSLFRNYDDLSELLDSVKSGSFDSADDLVNDFEVTVKKLYTDIMESKRSITIEEAASLDLIKDDYGKAIELIKKKYDRQNKTPTGFPLLDNDILLGGFDPSRLYIFGGASGSGKSTILNNLIIKSACSGRVKPGIEPIDGISKVYIYITLENTIEESLLRTYQPLFDKTLVQVLQELTAGEDIKEKLYKKLLQNQATIIMKYFPAMSISAVDIMGVLDEIIEEYGKERIYGLYIDYLDLLRTDRRYDMYRMELAHITLNLKSLAVEYNIPVITATQLSRAAYRVQESKGLNVDQMSESIKKVEHADFVALLAAGQEEKNVVYSKIGKNRAGKSNVALTFDVDFSRFKFKNVSRVSNKEKVDKISETPPMTFTGLQKGF